MSNKMKAHIISLSILLAVASAFPTAGYADLPGGSGGGDTGAVEFIAKGKQVAAWAESHPKQLSFDAKQVRATLNSLVKSLQNGEKARLSFTNDEVKDANGISKAALFNRNENTIVVNRPQWTNAKDDARTELVALELFGLSGSLARYEEATKLKEGLKLSTVQCLAISGLRGQSETLTRNYDVHNFSETEEFSFRFSELVGINLFLTIAKVKNSDGTLSANFATVEAIEPSTKKRVMLQDRRQVVYILKDRNGGSWFRRVGKYAILCGVGNPNDFLRASDTFSSTDSTVGSFKSWFEKRPNP